MPKLHLALSVAGTRFKQAFGQQPQISLLTDFWSNRPDESPYAIHSAISSIHPRVKIKDICHGVPLGNVLVGASKLNRAVSLQTERKGTIYVAVVDPKVGTERKRIIVEISNGRYLVGPDNGVLSLAAKTNRAIRAVEITNEEFMLLQLANSRTFDGKDVFGPAAAHLARGVPIEEFGPELDIVQLKAIRLVQKILPDMRVGNIVDYDGVGAIRTNIPNHFPSELIGKSVQVTVTSPDSLVSRSNVRIVQTFDDCDLEEASLIQSSTGALDIVLRAGSNLNVLGLFSLDERNIDVDESLQPKTTVEIALKAA